MKKILLTLALAAFAMTANAQFVIGGNLGVNHNGNHDKDFTAGSTATTTISIMPKIGYQLNENMQIGAQLGWDYTYNRAYTDPAGNSKTYNSRPQSAIEIDPYFRYNVASWKNFTVFAEAQLGFRMGLESKTHAFVDGSEVAGVYYGEHDVERIAIYCEKDVLCVANLMLRLQGKDIYMYDQMERANG